MNQGRPSRRTKTSNWHNSTITTTIITIIITIMLGADTSMMSPASSWCLPDTVVIITVIITTTITIITASTAATIEVARAPRGMTNKQDLRVLFFCAA